MSCIKFIIGRFRLPKSIPCNAFDPFVFAYFWTLWCWSPDEPFDISNSLFSSHVTILSSRKVCAAHSPKCKQHRYMIDTLPVGEVRCIFYLKAISDARTVLLGSFMGIFVKFSVISGAFAQFWSIFCPFLPPIMSWTPNVEVSASMSAKRNAKHVHNVHQGTVSSTKEHTLDTLSSIRSFFLFFFAYFWVLEYLEDGSAYQEAYYGYLVKHLLLFFFCLFFNTLML